MAEPEFDIEKTMRIAFNWAHIDLTSPRNKLLMDRIDELFTEDPARGTRRLRAALRIRFSLDVCRSKIRSLMARMGIYAIYWALNTSKTE